MRNNASLFVGKAMAMLMCMRSMQMFFGMCAGRGLSGVKC